MDRREAIDAALKKQSEPVAVEILLLGLKDQYAGLRGYTAGKLDITKEQIRNKAEQPLYELAQKDAKRTVKATAIAKLGDYKSAKYAPLFKFAVNDSSYTVAGNALDALSKIDSVAAYNEAKRLSAFPAKGKLAASITKTMIKSGDESSAEMILSTFEDMPLNQAKFDMLPSLIDFLGKVKSTETFKRGVDDILAFETQFPESFREQASAYFNNMLRNVQKQKSAGGMKEQSDYIENKLKTPNP